ncbi:multiubiquitin domain-containing protein [Nocardioides sp. WG-D5]
MTASEAEKAANKVVTITINTRSFEWGEKKISFEQVVELAFPGQPYDPAGTLVEVSRGHGPDHALRPGKDVVVKNGMDFVVEPANRS